MVSDGLFRFAFHDGDGGEAACILEDLVADRATLDAVAAEQGLWCAEIVGNECELPGEIAGVLNTGVHALATGGAVDVGCVAGKEYATGAIV